MTEALRMWRERADPFTAVVMAAADWDAPTPCAQWRARDIVAHIVSTEREFLEQHNLLGGDAAADTGPVRQWTKHEKTVAGLLADPDVARRSFAGYFGPSTIGETLAGFYGGDLLVHRWDLAVSQGLDALLTEKDLNDIGAAMDGFGDLAYAPGLFDRPVDVPDGADLEQRVLARTGRTVPFIAVE
ncbi:maleylpyruvate isomerase N-terminal domain-containing protein [Arthrobacter sp. zg-Y916]|uniref:maleylpyruvate isomerase N-terminal domain-containing protein n=1 Tax=Arthrobacter sp. zg-Y916 TaxID=2894190 RepID=UPI001E2E0411|nr:maleylpyruvate isomerase N-terminal domain-containing protein [Arthrobacter sp. zg-Y916]MCC9192268.1 maleylpyruvate isomerase N-terminal domain-containing protein [Arthrobacter sp. zg-Y916]